MKTTTWNTFLARAPRLPFVCALVLALAGPSMADPPLPVIPATNFNITSFGAFGDGVSNNATAIQNTINAAAAAGGGTVVVASVGILTNYLSGPVNLSNSVCLQVNAGTKLQMLPYASWPGTTPFINGTGLHDVEINGSGTIDGNAGFTIGFVTNWWGLATTNAPVANRPNFINFSGCSNILIQGVTLQNPPTFHIMAKGNNVNLTIQNMTESTIGTSHNTDGMDIGSSNVLVRNCNISVGDDNIEIGGSAAAVGNMTVSNCTFGTGHGVSLGSLVNGAGGGVQNLIVSNCTFDGTDYGIRMKSDRDRGGLCQNLQYLDITMTNVDYPIVIYSYYNTVGTPNSISPFRASTDTVHTITVTTPIWRNITISNLTATGLTGNNIAGIIWGVPEMLVSNITLYNVNISAPTKTFDIYNARDIRIINSEIATPSSTNSFTLYNAEIIITNSVANTNLVKLGGLAAPPTNNTFALFNTQAAITETNVLGAGPITLGGSTLTFTNAAVSFSNSVSVASTSRLVLTNGNNTFGGALTGPGPLSLILTNGANLRFDQGANVWGGSNTAFDAGASGILNNHSAGSISIFLGALSGGSGSTLQGSDQAGPAVDTYVIGSLNSNTTFAGVITNGTSGGTPHTVALTKVGTGALTLSNASGVFGSATVSNGTLVVTNSSLSLSGGFELGGGTAIVRAAGSLAVTNAGNTGSINVRTGAMTITGGVVLVDQLFVTNGIAGQFELKGGTLTPGATTVRNGTLCFIGSSPIPATLNVTRGSHSFADGLYIGGPSVASSAAFTGIVWMTGGTLAVSNASSEMRLGNFGGSGFVTMSNGLMLVKFLTIGGPGSAGTFTMAGGTNLVSSSMFVGNSFFATGTVWMTGGEFNNSNNFLTTYIGFLCPGQMTVSNGLVRAYNVVAGTGANGIGRLNLFGGTETISSSLVLGDCGDGSIGLVTVAGGNLNVTNAAHTAVVDVRNGTLTLSAGTLRIDTLIVTNSCGHFVHTGGTLSVTSTNFSAGLDADGDGIPNGYEQTNGFDPFNPADANLDADGDGFTNLEEYQAGTNPNDANSTPFRITAIAREGDDIRITWKTFGGATNRVLVSAGTANGSYTNNFSNLSPLILVPVTGATSTNYLDVAGATNAPARYYRVRQGAGTQGVRFLFDAGHAQSAGNADWVIDADLHNLNWNNTGTFTLSGTDSNAQRIPTPAASGIISNTAETYWQGGISAWAVDLVKRGHSVETLPAGATFTYNTANSQDLTNYNVVVVDEPNILFTLAEKQALLSFVSNGGSLFMIGDHIVSDRDGDGQDSVSVWNDFLTNNLVTNNPFGIIFRSSGTGSNGSGSNTFSRSIVGNPILNGPVGVATNLEFFNGNEFQIDNTKNPTAVSHLWFGTLGDSNNFCGLAALQYGNGRVVVVGDSSCIEDGTGDPGDGLFNGYTLDAGGVQHIWILNASEWLAAPAP